VSEFRTEWVRTLQFHIRRADGIVGPITRAEMERGLTDGRFHEEMPASVDMGTSWHPLRIHLGLPEPEPLALPKSLEKADQESPLVAAEPSGILDREPEAGFLVRHWGRLVAFCAGTIQGFLPVAVPMVGGATYLMVAQEGAREKHQAAMEEYDRQLEAAIEPAEIDRALDPAEWARNRRPYVALAGVAEADRKARERISPEAVLRLKPGDGPPTADFLEAQKKAGKDWVASDQKDLLVAAGHQAQAGISGAEKVEDFKGEPGVRYLRRKAVEKSVLSAWDAARRELQEKADIQRKAAEESAQGLARVVQAVRSPVVRQLFPGLDKVCENPPAENELGAALGRVKLAGQEAP